MFEISELIYSILNTNTALASVVSTKIFPLVADQDTDLPFVLYYVGEEPVYSKQALFAYRITIESYHSNYNDAVKLAEKVRQAIKAATEVFMYESGNPEWIAENTVKVTQIFTYKK